MYYIMVSNIGKRVGSVLAMFTYIWIHVTHIRGWAWPGVDGLGKLARGQRCKLYELNETSYINTSFKIL